jgi:hypothetical protein
MKLMDKRKQENELLQKQNMIEGVISLTKKQDMVYISTESGLLSMFSLGDNFYVVDDIKTPIRKLSYNELYDLLFSIVREDGLINILKVE